MAVGKPLNLRLFLEGVEVPIISAAVTVNVNAPAAASLQIVPLDEALQLKPRTMVHVFFLDAKDRRDREGELINVGDFSGQYKLLFSGEIVGLSFVQTPMSRAVVLQCVDFSSYWDQATAMALEFGPGGNAFSNFGNIMGGSIGMFDDIVNQQPQKILDWLRSKPLTPGLKTVSGLAGGIIRMMEAIGGVIPHHKGINDFFTVGELRCRIRNQITAEENDNTARNVMGGKVFDEWLRHGLQNAGQLVSFRDMALLLMRYIYYEFIPNPTAKFDDTDVLIGKTSSSSVVLGETPTGAEIASILQTAIDRISETQTGGSKGEVSREEAVSVGHMVTDILRDKLKPFEAANPKFIGAVRKVEAKLIQARDAAASIVRGAEGASTSNSRLALLTALRGAYWELGTSRTTKAKAKDTFTSQRLKSLIFRPDCWFAPPPTCNVIFPEMYSQFSFDRSFLTEVTRVFIAEYNTLIGKDPLLSGTKVLAPHNVGELTKEISKKTGLTGARVLLDYELHTGIVPRSEWVTNLHAHGAKTNDEDAKTAKGNRIGWVSRVALFHFFKYRYAPRQASVAGRFSPKLVCGFPGVIIKAPYIVEGVGGPAERVQSGLSSSEFTSALSDRDLMNFLSDNAEALHAPQQLLGMIAGLQHTVGQDGGNTSVSMHSVRPHRGVDDDFFKIYLTQNDQKIKKLLKTTIYYHQAVADESLMKLLAGVTPQGSSDTKPISKKQKNTAKREVSGGPKNVDPRSASSSSFSVTTTTEATKITEPPPEFTVRGAIPPANKDGVLVPSPQGKIGVGSKGRYGGKVVGVEVHEPALTADEKGVGRVFLNGVTIYEELDLKVDAKVPLEVILRPRWFSSSYSNAKIGEKIYQPFFGCGSILDQVRVVGAPGLDLPADEPEDDVTDAAADKPPETIISELKEAATSQLSLSTEKAVDILSYLYGLVKRQGLDVDEFITQYNDRPIATMEQMLGYNLDYVQIGSEFFPTEKDRSAGEYQVGFHSTAIHPFLVETGELAGLLKDPTTMQKLINLSGSKEVISGRFDVRKAKRDRVLAYKAAFRETRGFRG